jgi:hypothetical protein
MKEVIVQDLTEQRKMLKTSRVRYIHTVNQADYVEVMKRLRDSVRTETSQRWPKDWILHHENTPAHIALSVKEFFAQKSITEMIWLRMTSVSEK